MTRRHLACLSIAVLLSHLAANSSNAAGWSAGTAKADITPKSPLWMAGYGSRTSPSEGAVHPLWAKALFLKGPDGKPAVVLTLDVCGIDRSLSKRVRDAIEAKHGTAIDRIVISCSHTHTGPVLGDNLITMYKMSDAQYKDVAEYTEGFLAAVLGTVDQAAARLEPVELAWDTGTADFAVNRRENVEADVPALRGKGALKGPVDHDVPVLRATTADGKVKAVLFGYACHCTVLSFNKFTGDYAGFAQIDIEKAHPGAQAMFVAGCGADQNPLPRRTVELAAGYGKQLADEVVRVLGTKMRAADGPIQSSYEEIDLKFGDLPPKSQFEAEAKSANYPLAARAKVLLQTIESAGALPSTYPYPVQAWRLGDLTWVFLGGEVVVDYSLRIKRNLGSSKTWVSSYCNDVMAYVPSLRVLKEGGYEGATSMIYYGLPTAWSESVEEQIIEAVLKCAGR